MLQCHNFSEWKCTVRRSRVNENFRAENLEHCQLQKTYFFLLKAFGFFCLYTMTISDSFLSSNACYSVFHRDSIKDFRINWNIKNQSFFRPPSDQCQISPACRPVKHQTIKRSINCIESDEKWRFWGSYGAAGITSNVWFSSLLFFLSFFWFMTF